MRSKITIFLLLLLALLPAKSFAAEISSTTTKGTFAKNEQFLLKVYIDTEGVAINAIEGSLTFPPGMLEIKEINDGNSAVNFWLEEPHAEKAGNIYFSGITPGGFYGDRIFLFEVVFKATKDGDGEISYSAIRALANDGQGSAVDTTISPYSFSIAGEIKEGDQPDVLGEDNEAPEEFTPLVGRDPTIFEGRYFLAWSTVDKGSGIDHYEIREGFASKYSRAVPPYLLKDQALGTVVYVKAIDKRGNVRIVRVNAQNSGFHLDPILLLATILIIWILASVWRKLRQRSVRS